MNSFKGIVKNGWHPEQNKTESPSAGSGSRVDKVKGLMGKGGSEPREDPHSHQSTPLSTLKDPASFGPPPKRILNPDGTRQAPQPRHASSREEVEAKPPPVPYRADTTNLSTAHLPKPPVFRPGQAAKPNLPPRLPPRQNEYPHEYTPNPPPPYSETTFTIAQGQLNQGAINRLGQAGVSVPGFGIGRTASPPVPPRQTASPVSAIPATQTSHGPQLGELQSGFAKMPTPSSEASSTGTTWAQKQAALKTAGSLRDDPSKVSVSDMRSAASTANNFRERHGEQAAAGWKTASGLNQKYGISNNVNSFASSSSSAPAQSSTAGGLGKKAAPPPPPKKKELVGSSRTPPPVPLGSKPKF